MQPVTPYPFGSALNTPTLSPQKRRVEVTAAPATIDHGGVIKITDWTALAWAVFDFVVCAVAGIGQIGSQFGLSAILLPGAVVAFIVLLQKIAGTKFDLGRGTVRFYSWWLPRTLALADIRDANCEFAITLSPSRVALALCCGGSSSRTRTGHGQRTYMVNLSGAFGSRQVRFYSKRRRDTFLSVLRDQAPACRITRWF